MSIDHVFKEKHRGDKEQLKFIFSNADKIIVTAPAGCGKTTSMVSKIARELSKGGISSGKKVLALTYSVNAARKIKHSLKNLLPDLVDNVQHYLNKVDVANYHSFARSILSKHGYCLNSEFIFLSQFKIVDEGDSVLGLYITNKDKETLGLLNKAVKESDWDSLLGLLDDYWSILDQKLIPKHLITYNGILISAIRLLQKEQISSFYKEYYKMLIIDEFQDTNLLGFFLIRKLIGNNQCIFLGDEVQKIYGFLGAINGIFDHIIDNYQATEIIFKKNYRFRENERMKKLDLLLRDYAEHFKSSSLKAQVFFKQLSNDKQEDEFITKGIKRIILNKENKVAVLVRAGWNGNSIAELLDQEGITFFNNLIKETDTEFLAFYNVALEEFHNIESRKATQRDLQKCLVAVKARETEIYQKPEKKYIFDSMFKLLDILFKESKKVEGTLKDKYDYINSTLENKGLKYMIEFIDDQVILTTIHSAKGLEWDYVILPKLISGLFPNRHVCSSCKKEISYHCGRDYCKFVYRRTMENIFKEEINLLYVAVTRAKKDVFLTFNAGMYNKNLKSCLLSLKGLELLDYEWEEVI